jgi:murein DD-endopeptidase MepM/ murein hydrolase activator NlpD
MLTLWWGRVAAAVLVGFSAAFALRVGGEPPAGLGAGVLAAPDESAAVVTVLPEAPVQGNTLSVIVNAPGSPAVAVSFDGTSVRAYALPGGARRALIGTDPTVATGTHRLVVTVTQPGRTARRIPRDVRLGSGQFAVRTVTLGPKTAGLITAQNAATEQRLLGSVLSRRTPDALWSGPFGAPSDGTMDSPYGDQSFYNGRRAWWHQGMDYAASAGAPVVAANDGIVALAQLLPLGGNTVVIDHGQGVLTEYLHLSAFTVRPGARVAKGTLIGRIGATGLVTGPSLHWGLYVNGTWVNPSYWMEPRAGVTE